MLRWLRRQIDRYRRAERGATAVEFAFVGTAFMVFVVGIYAIGLYALTLNRLQQGVEDAARHAAIHADATDDELEEMVLGYVQSIGGTEDNLEVTLSESLSNGIAFKEVSANYVFTWRLPFLPAEMEQIEVDVTSKSPVTN